MSAMETIKQSFTADLATVDSKASLAELKNKYLGKKGHLKEIQKNSNFAAMSPEERRASGQQFNEVKSWIDQAIKAKLADFDKALFAEETKLGFDLTAPSIPHSTGNIHPVALIQMELEDIFGGMGFMVESGREVEDEYYNFDALNIPGDHPAREMQDTFWLTNGQMMRTHTSANQVRMLEKHGAPLRAIFPGRCFRYETMDASHETSFHQLEGLLVDKNISVSHLVGIMRNLLREVFQKDVKIRLRPGFFPFVEPGFELDLSCLICDGDGCSTCKKTGWIELMPCGIVHPKVLEAGNVDPNEYSGFAFGLGMTRLAMMKFGIPDIRLFHSGDIRFYEQFPLYT